MPGHLSRRGEENAVHRLNECTVVGLGNDETRREQADDDVDQLFAAEAARGDGRGGVDRIAELVQERPLQLRQVGEQIAQDERRLGLEQRTRRVAGSSTTANDAANPSEKVRSSKIATASMRRSLLGK